MGSEKCRELPSTTQQRSNSWNLNRIGIGFQSPCFPLCILHTPPSTIIHISEFVTHIYILSPVCPQTSLSFEGAQVFPLLCQQFLGFWYLGGRRFWLWSPCVLSFWQTRSPQDLFLKKIAIHPTSALQVRQAGVGRGSHESLKSGLDHLGLLNQYFSSGLKRSPLGKFPRCSFTTSFPHCPQ